MDNALQEQLATWRHHLHKHPETGFEEIARPTMSRRRSSPWAWKCIVASAARGSSPA